MLEVRPTQTRAFVPVYVRSDQEAPVTVREKGGANGNSFLVNLSRSGPREYRGSFWLEREGKFEVFQPVGSSAEIVSLSIGPQHFLDFGREFGLFTILLGIGLAVIFLWVRKRAGSTSHSS